MAYDLSIQLPNDSCSIENIKFSISPKFKTTVGENLTSTVNPDLMKFSWDTDQSLSFNETKTRFYVIRHGEILSNIQKKLSGGEVDEDLTDNGKEEVKKLAKKIRELQEERKTQISAVYSSPLIRAAHTAGVLAKELCLEVQISDNLKEICWGQASQKTYQECIAIWGDQSEQELILKYPELKDLWNHLPNIPNAEKYNDLLKRAITKIQSISRQNPGKEIVLVSHGSLITTLVQKCLNSMDRKKKPDIGNCSISVFCYSEKMDGSDSCLDFLGLAN